MNKDERRKVAGLIKQMQESDSPTKANMAVFFDERGTMMYAGIITDWPKIIATDIEWGEVKELDTTKAPFAGRTVKFFSPFKGS